MFDDTKNNSVVDNQKTPGHCQTNDIMYKCEPLML